MNEIIGRGIPDVDDHLIPGGEFCPACWCHSIFLYPGKTEKYNG
jgi:hypothetical protein